MNSFQIMTRKAHPITDKCSARLLRTQAQFARFDAFLGAEIMVSEIHLIRTLNGYRRRRHRQQSATPLLQLLTRCSLWDHQNPNPDGNYRSGLICGTVTSLNSIHFFRFLIPFTPFVLHDVNGIRNQKM